MLQAIFFDVGNVLLEQDRSVFSDFDSEYGLVNGRTKTAWRRYCSLAQIGNIRSPADFPEFPLLAKFIPVLYSTNRVKPGMLEILDQLSTMPYKLGIISNFTPDLNNVLLQIGVMRYFDTIVHSARLRIAKPDVEIYRIACSRIGIAPKETVLVDNNEENVQAAKAISMQGIVFVSPAILIKHLGRYGIIL